MHYHSVSVPADQPAGVAFGELVDHHIRLIPNASGLLALYQHLNHEPQTRRKSLKSKELERQNLY
jgi:hypothetical protein